ncbi:hypothetical protein, partial [Lacticaseibacillus casei]|uniref:hypothetical protein n=1 Tax=Lacticaseibacillus casei TaxID=1582 RepID=UPI001782179E
MNKTIFSWLNFLTARKLQEQVSQSLKDNPRTGRYQIEVVALERLLGHAANAPSFGLKVLLGCAVALL